jgi:hypothetical protein
MSSSSVALKEGVPAAAESEAGATFTAMSVMKAKFLKFLNKLPDHYEDVDPATYRRLPVPY